MKIADFFKFETIQKKKISKQKFRKFNFCRQLKTHSQSSKNAKGEQWNANFPKWKKS